MAGPGRPTLRTELTTTACKEVPDSRDPLEHTHRREIYMNVRQVYVLQRSRKEPPSVVE